MKKNILWLRIDDVIRLVVVAKRASCWRRGFIVAQLVRVGCAIVGWLKDRLAAELI